MRAEDFSGWLSAIVGLSAAQRREALDALTKADEDRPGAAPESVPAASPTKGAKPSRREDTLGTTSHERVEAQGCPHCAGREVIGWGRSHGLLRFQRADQDPDGASAQERAVA